MCSICIYRDGEARAVYYTARSRKAAEFVVRAMFGKKGALKFGEYVRIVPLIDTPEVPVVWNRHGYRQDVLDVYREQFMRAVMA